MLTSQAREILGGVETVIVDEIHAVARPSAAPTRADARAARRRCAATPGAAIGLSATQRPLEEVGRFLVGAGRARSRSSMPASARRSTSRSIVPVETWSSPTATDDSIRWTPVTGGEATRALDLAGDLPRLLELVREHRSTIIFVNSRAAGRAPRAAPERARQRRRRDDADRDEIARAHHGSLAREERRDVEELLKAGAAAVPRRDVVARARHRHGRGRPRRPGRVARSRSRAACSASAARATGRRHLQGPHLPEVPRRPARVRRRRRAHARRARSSRPVVPRNPLDVLAQQIVAIAATPSDELARRRARTRSSRARTPTPSSRATLLENVLDMLAGRYPSERVRRAAPAHRLGPRRRHDPRAQGRAPPRGHQRRARSPTAACSASSCPTAARVGELDEEMVYEARPGQTFLLGASTWRIEEIDARPRHRHPGARRPGALPVLAAATASAARRSSASAIGAFCALGRRPGRPRRCCATTTTSTSCAAATCSTTCASSRRRRASSRRPDDRRRALPRRDRRLAAVHPLARSAAASTRRGRSRSARRSATSSASSPTRSGPTTGSSSTSPTPTSRPAPTAS